MTPPGNHRGGLGHHQTRSLHPTVGIHLLLFETLLSLKLLIYQIYFAWKYFGGAGGAGGFSTSKSSSIRGYRSGPFATIITIFILMVLIELFIPHLCLGAIIGLGAKAHRKEEVRGGLVLALYNFSRSSRFMNFLS